MWIVIIRVNAESKWCAYGPFDDFESARRYDHGLAGTGLDRQLLHLLKPWERSIHKPWDLLQAQSCETVK